MMGIGRMTAHLGSSIMAKGQQRKNKEVKKPKQEKKIIVPVGKLITPSKPQPKH
jgi:hypothetical protein